MRKGKLRKNTLWKSKSETECDIRENFGTKEYPNIFVSKKKITRANVRIYSYKKFDTNKCPNKYLCRKLDEYSTLTHSRMNVQIYSYKQI